METTATIAPRTYLTTETAAAQFLAHHGRPCTDAHARQIAEEMWPTLYESHEANEAVRQWIGRTC